MIYLDISRLLRRLEAPTPTGIDRVEFEYAKHLSRVGGRFVAQNSHHLVELPSWLAHAVIDHLDALWVQGTAPQEELEKQIERWRRIKPVSKIQNQVERFLFQLRQSNWSSRWKLLNLEREHIKKRSSFFPWPLVAFVLVLFPGIVSKFYETGPKATKPEFQFNRVSKNSLYVNVGHWGLERRDLFQALKKQEGVFLSFYIHDVLPISHPELFKEGVRTKHMIAMNNILDFADFQFTNSSFTRAEMERLFDKANVNETLEIGVSIPESMEQTTPKARVGFVTIGTIEPRKNYLWLVRAWLDMCEQQPGLVDDEVLTIFGKKGWINDDEYQELTDMISKSDRVELVSGANDGEVMERLRSARAYVSAAHVEGWGMPLAESVTLGTPVIASNIDAHREVTQGNATFFDLNDPSSLISIMSDFYDDDVLQKKISETDAFRPWDWDDHFGKFHRSTGNSSNLSAKR